MPVASPPVLMSEEEEEQYPEGGLQAWLVVLGAWCAMVPSMGLINTISVLQARVVQHELAGYSESTVGWIFSIHAFIVYFAGVQVGVLQWPPLNPPNSSWCETYLRSTVAAESNPFGRPPI